VLKLVILCTARTGKAVKNHRATLERQKVKSCLVRRLPEQFAHMPIDSLNTEKDPNTCENGQNSSTSKVQVSPEMPARPQLKQVLSEAGKSPCTLSGKTPDTRRGKGSISHFY
jgi:hypothetical protein